MSTPDSSDPSGAPPDGGAGLDLADEVFGRAAELVGLGAPQIEGWVSGAFGLWSHDDEVLAFIERCRSARTDVAALLCAAIAYLADGEVAAAAASAGGELAEVMPQVAGHLGTAVAMAGWEVRAPFGRSVVVGFRSAGVEGDHAVLVELDEQGKVSDLRLSGSPAELLDLGDRDSATVTVVEYPVPAAVEEVVAGWDASAALLGEVGPGLVANQRVVRRRLEGLAGRALPLLVVTGLAPDLMRGMSAAEIADADEAARFTLRAALGQVPDVDPEVGWIEVVHGSVQGLSRREYEALFWLEWADWLGVGIGLVRAGPGSPVSGQTLVDHVNRCGEVSSTIPADDREYAAWAFDTAIEHLVDHGLVEGGRLTERGHRSLHRSLHEAWCGTRAGAAESDQSAG